MKKLLILLILLLSFDNLFPMQPFDSLVPKPRQAYVRLIYSTVFSIHSGMKIYISKDNPQYAAATRFNENLTLAGIDTLEVTFYNGDEIQLNGILLTLPDTFTNKILKNIPDQLVQISADYPGAEGYIMDVLPGQVIITGCDKQGLFNGITTFFKLINSGGQNDQLFAMRVVDAPEFPIRWLYMSTNLQVGTNVDKAKSLINIASDLKLNGAVLADSKLSRISTNIDRYFDSLVSLNNYSKKKNIEIVPCIFPFGYSESLLWYDPNLASGLPVKNQRFAIDSDTAKLIPTIDVSIPNGGFENYTDNNFPGFLFIDQPGKISFADTEVKHSGNASIRLQDFSEYSPQNGHGRVCFRTPVNPFTMYHISCWVRTENLAPSGIINTAVLGNKSNCNYYRPSIPSTTDWRKIDFTFNSLDNDTVNIYWGVWGAKGGKLWWDDLLFEETCFVNILRRDGTPFDIYNQDLDLIYIEGRDYDSIFDPKTGNIKWPGDYDSYHTPPTFRRKTNGALRNGDTVIMSYYHAVLINSDQVMITMSDPKVYNIIEKDLKFLDSLIAPETYFMQHDEIRTMNWDDGDLRRNLKPAEILADNVNKCIDIIKRNDPDADYWVWTDMFDEYHNAVSGNYYLVNGDLRGSADLIQNSVGMCNWNGREQNNIVFNSLKFFEEKGFRQISAPYYDNDENQIRRWKEWTQATDNFHGMMYTTWQQKYDHLSYFAEYAWNHAPYIYHYPPDPDSFDGNLSLNITVKGDEWDSGWNLENLQVLYRTDENSRFTGIDVELTQDLSFNISKQLEENAKWVQYYIIARDNRGWTTRIPFGGDQYYEIGERSSGISYFENKSINIYPNPTEGDFLNIEFFTPVIYPAKIKILDVSGRKIIDRSITVKKIKLNISRLESGIYYININGNGFLLNKKFIRIK